MHALRVCTGAKGGCTCQRKCGERVARSSEMAMTIASKTARRIPEREHPLETIICSGMMQKRTASSPPKRDSDAQGVAVHHQA